LLLLSSQPAVNLFGGELGDSLKALGDGSTWRALRKESGRRRGGLDFAGGDNGFLVVAGELGPTLWWLLLLEDVVDTGFHNRHSLGGDAGVGVDLQ